MRYLKPTAAAVLATAAAAGGSAAYTTSPAAAAQKPATSRAENITVFVPLNDKTRAPALVIGAIGDHGTLVSANRNGKPDANGNYAKLVLTHGSFELDGRSILRALKPVAAPNLNSCTATIAGTASVRVFNGTGAYKGIHGTLRATAHAGLLGGRDANGRCDQHAAPVDVLGSITATGNVGF